MRRRVVRDTLIGVALVLVAGFGALYQAAASAEPGADGKTPLPRLICPLH